MPRPLDDLDYDIDATTYTIRGLMVSLDKLYKDRDRELKKILDSVEYKTGCSCSYQKTTRGRAKLTISKTCRVHGHLLVGVDNNIDK